MLAVVVAGGDLPAGHAGFDDSVRRAMLEADLLIAADGGLVHCAAHDAWPQVLVGDLDSAPGALVAEAAVHAVEMVVHPIDKDATDLELAMELAVERGASRIVVLGLFGGRVDHELANITLLASSRWSPVEVSGGDGLRTMWVVTRALSLRQPPGTLLTLLPWGGDAVGVTTEGLQWPLRSETLTAGSTRGVSNVCVDTEQSVAVDAGTVLVVADRSVISGR